MQERVKIIATVDAQFQKEFTIDVEALNSSQRWRNALKKIGLCWLVAIPMIFVPAAHFILVPGFVIGGIVMFFATLPLDHKVNRGDVTCPKCNEPLTIDQTPFVWPKRDQCEKCDTRLLIEKV